MINGWHGIVYSDDPVATRAFFRDVLGWPYVDAHDGWLIFKTPPSELGVHPTEGAAGERWATPPHHELFFMCDDIESTVKALRAKGADVDDRIQNQGFGLVTSVAVPGAGRMQLYQPRHPVAYALDDPS